MKLNEAEAVIEALLFLSGDVVTLSFLAGALNLDKATTRAITLSLKDKYEEEQRGLEIIEIEDGFQMRAHPRLFDILKNTLNHEKKQPLSPSLLETLAIIAYKQPVTKAFIEEIRGVNADHAVNKLIERGLIKEAGRSNLPGRPLLFCTTNEFLRCFGFSSIKELPSINDFENT